MKNTPQLPRIRPNYHLGHCADLSPKKVEASQWRLVETGRVVLFTAGEHATKLAVIVEIIDHKRVRLRPGKPPGGLWRHIGGMREEGLQELEVNMNTTGPR